MKEQLESALRYLKDGGDITRACIEYSKTTNSSAVIVGLLRVRELINIALQSKDSADGEGRCRCGEFSHTELCPLYKYPDRR